MSKKKVRRVASQTNVHLGDISMLAFNTRAGGSKHLNIGPEIRKKDLLGLGAIDASSTQKILPGTQLALYNNSGSVQWVTMNRSEDGALSAPTGLANGFPLKPNDWTYLSMGENDQIRTSSALVGIYILEDDSTLYIVEE